MAKDLRDISSIPELGNCLKAKREKQEIPLEQVEAITKIRSKYIVALEAGDFSQIPGGMAYVKGFLRNYSTFLGLDANEIMIIYAELAKTPHTGPKNHKHKSSMAESLYAKGADARRKSKVTTALVFLLAVFFGAVLLKGFMKSDPKMPPEAPPVSTPSPQDPTPQKEEPATEAREETAEEVQAIVVLAQEDGFRNVYQVEDSNDLALTLTVLQDRCWLSSSLDGIKDFEGTLVKGEELVVSAKNSIVMRVGNPQVVNIIINQQDMGNPGGNSRDFIIERSN